MAIRHHSSWFREEKTHKKPFRSKWKLERELFYLQVHGMKGKVHYKKTFLSHRLREKAFLQGRKKIMDGFLCGLFIAY